MLALLRFDIPEDEAEEFHAGIEAVMAVFADRPGFVRGRIGRSPDEPTAWVLLTEWEGVGAYRRSLSAYEIKLATPLLGRGRNEVSAFEVVARS